MSHSDLDFWPQNPKGSSYLDNKATCEGGEKLTYTKTRFGSCESVAALYNIALSEK